MFYKLIEDELVEAMIVTAPDYFLVADDHEKYTYPVDGWVWFDDIRQAREHYGLN